MCRVRVRLLPGLLCAFIGVGVIGASHAQGVRPFEGLAREMSQEEWSRAGLGQLSEQERAALDAWLRGRFNSQGASEATSAGVDHKGVGAAKAAQAVIVPTPSAQAADASREAAIEAEVERRVAEELAAAEKVDSGEPFEAVLKSSFEGWSGKTAFYLENGQVWRQRKRGNYRYRGEGLDVRFSKNGFGGWEMELLGSGRVVLVKRIK